MQCSTSTKFQTFSHTHTHRCSHTAPELCVMPFLNARSCFIPFCRWVCWHQTLIYPRNIHQVSRTLGRLGHKTRTLAGAFFFFFFFFNTVSVKWLKVNGTLTHSERSNSCSCSNNRVALKLDEYTAVKQLWIKRVCSTNRNSDCSALGEGCPPPHSDTLTLS